MESGKSPPFAPGEMVPGTVYRVLRFIGAGGMGSVFDVEDTTVGKRYVLKTLNPDHAGRKDLAKRMENEARTLARLAHTNIVEVITAGVSGEPHRMPYYVMVKLNGENLRSVLSKKRSLELPYALHITIDLLDALDFAHENGVIHRDVKPDNIFLHRDPQGVTVTKLLDFGIMRLLDAGPGLTAGRYMGTLRYSAPEQLRGDTLSPRIDLYAAGLVLYEMLAGRGPFDHLVDQNKIAAAHIGTPPPDLTSLGVIVPESLERLIRAVLSKDPTKRPKDAYTFAKQLRNLSLTLAAERAAAASIHVQETVIPLVAPVPDVPSSRAPLAGLLSSPSPAPDAPSAVPTPVVAPPSVAALAADLSPAAYAPTEQVSTRHGEPRGRDVQDIPTALPPYGATGEGDATPGRPVPAAPIVALNAPTATPSSGPTRVDAPTLNQPEGPVDRNAATRSQPHDIPAPRNDGSTERLPAMPRTLERAAPGTLRMTPPPGGLGPPPGGRSPSMAEVDPTSQLLAHLPLEGSAQAASDAAASHTLSPAASKLGRPVVAIGLGLLATAAMVAALGFVARGLFASSSAPSPAVAEPPPPPAAAPPPSAAQAEPVAAPTLPTPIDTAPPPAEAPPSSSGSSSATVDPGATNPPANPSDPARTRPRTAPVPRASAAPPANPSPAPPAAKKRLPSSGL